MLTLRPRGRAGQGRGIIRIVTSVLDFELAVCLVPFGRPEARESGDETVLAGGLENTRLFLEPTHVFHDLIDIVRFDGHDLRHIAELPMMGLDPVGRSPLEGGVSVVIGFVDLVHQRGPLGGPDTTNAMTDCAVGRERLFAGLEIGRNRSNLTFRLRFTLATCRCRAEDDHDETDPQRPRYFHHVVFPASEKPD